MASVQPKMQSPVAGPVSLVAWYEGRSALVTGGAGFMGKVLLEKMLRALPGLRRVYLLLRPKRGAEPAHRLKNMLALPLFEKLRHEQSQVLEKLVVVQGDLLEPGLGLTDADRALLVAEVSVVFHAAATLHLESPLGPALRHNVLGTQRMLELAKDMRHIQAFVHLSTTFCHPDEEVLEERCYPAPVPPAELLRFAQWMDDDALHLNARWLLGRHPNCYTYTKQLAETLVDEARVHIPTVIARPSIVLPSYEEPLPGWVDSLNGPVGLVAGAGKGVIRSMMAGRDFEAEVVPVDIAANAIISIAWDSAVRRSEKKATPVYNVTSGDTIHVTWGEVVDRGLQLVRENPFEGVVWYPDGDIRSSRLVHQLIVFFFHVIPAYLIDLLLMLAWQKTFMVRLQRRISTGLELLQYFTVRQWRFVNSSLGAVEQFLTPAERSTFRLSVPDLNVEETLKMMLLGARQYCLKEPLSSLPRARRHLKIMYVVHQVAKILFWYFVVYIPLSNIALFGNMLDAVSSAIFGNSFSPMLPLK